MSPVPREHWEHLREMMEFRPGTAGNRRTLDFVLPLHLVHGMNLAPPQPPQTGFLSIMNFLVLSVFDDADSSVSLSQDLMTREGRM